MKDYYIIDRKTFEVLDLIKSSDEYTRQFNKGSGDIWMVATTDREGGLGTPLVDIGKEDVDKILGEA